MLTLTFFFSCYYKAFLLSGVFFSSSDETGGGSSSSSPLLPLKKHSDLTLRKVRRHVLQLTQHWKNANNNIQHRLKTLQRTQTVD
jgi:hypothetical protein